MLRTKNLIYNWVYPVKPLPYYHSLHNIIYITPKQEYHCFIIHIHKTSISGTTTRLIHGYQREYELEAQQSNRKSATRKMMRRHHPKHISFVRALEWSRHTTFWLLLTSGHILYTLHMVLFSSYQSPLNGDPRKRILSIQKGFRKLHDYSFHDVTAESEISSGSSEGAAK